MLQRKQCWSDGGAQLDAEHVIPDTSHSFPRSRHCRVRTYSLNDLDCFASPEPLFQEERKDGTSSSSDLFARIAQLPQYPLFPCRSPEARSPTPPGLPAFGTIEAERLRLMPLTHMERLTRYLQQRLARRDVAEQHGPPVSVNPTLQHQNVTPAIRQSCDEPAEMLRRVLGTTRTVNVPVGPVHPKRSGLPRGVIRSAYPGALAQAGDRTQIRARFGVRASGHGVGQRNLDLHPYARRTNTSEIDAAVREIDKACREIAGQGHDGPISTRELPFPRRHENTSPKAASTTAMAIAESLTAIQAIEREQRALRALKASRKENVRLKAALKALRNSMPPATHPGEHIQTSSNISDLATVLRISQVDEMNPTSLRVPNSVGLPLRGDSEQTVDDIDFTALTEYPRMEEPRSYSSYSTYSYRPDQSDMSPLALPTHARQTLPPMESMLEHQHGEERRQATDEVLNRYSASEKTKCEHC